MVDNSLNHINNRLTNRLTYCDWDRQLIGPIYDKQGLEQGGIIGEILPPLYSVRKPLQVQYFFLVWVV